MSFVRRQILANPSSITLVLLHGYGSNEEDLLGLAPELRSGVSTICLRAPRELPFGGFAWFDIDWTPTEKILHTDQAVANRDLLIPVLRAIRNEFPSQKFILGGFSQGAMMSYGVAKAAPDLVDGLCLLSGMALPEFATGELKGIPTLIQHGTMDEVLPIEAGRGLRDSAATSGADLTYHEYAMGHQVSLQSLRDMNAWLNLRG